MRMRLMLVLAALTLIVGVSTASAGGGNSDAAQACQRGGWQHLARSDGSSFKNQGDCVSYAAQGGLFQSACVGGSENFSEDTAGSQPTTFSGGTIDTPYGAAGGVYGPLWLFADNSLFTGYGVNSFQLTLTHPVGSLQLIAESNYYGIGTTVTLAGYDAANNLVDQTSADEPAGKRTLSTLSLPGPSNEFKSFTITTSDPGIDGIFFTDITWGCN